MVDEQRTVKTKYVAELDKASYQQVNQLIESQGKKQIKLASDNLSINQDARKALLSQAKAQKENTDATNKQIKAEKSRLEILEKQNSQIRNQVGSIGDVDTALSAIRGGSSALTGSNIAGLEQAAAIFEVTEAFAQLKGAAPAAKEAIVNLATSMGASGLGLAAVAAGAVVAIAAVAKAISEDLIKGFEQGNRVIQGDIEARQQILDQIAQGAGSDEIFKSFAELNQIAQTEADKLAVVNDKLLRLESSDPRTRIVAQIAGTSDQLRGEYNEQAQVLVNAQEAVGVYNEALANGSLAQNDAALAALNQADALGKQYQIEQRVNQFAQSATTETLDARLQAIQTEKESVLAQQQALKPILDENSVLGEQARANYELLQDRVTDLNTETDLLNGVLGQTIRLRTDEKEAIEAAKEQAREREQIDRQRESTLSRLISLEDAANKALESFAQRQAELAIDRENRDSDRLEDFNTKRLQDEAEFNRDLIKISRSGNAEIIKAQQAVKDLDKEYMQGQIKANQDYNDELKALNRRRDLEELQDRQDHLLDLRNAEQNNDVLAFIRAEQQFKLDQQKKQQNQNLEDRERRDQLKAQLEDNRQAFLQRRALLLQEVTERRNQLKQSIDEAREKFRIEQDLAQQAFDTQQQRQQRDDQLADQRAKAALQRTLQEINVKAQAEINAIRQVTSAIGQLQAVANRIASSASSGSGGLSLSGSSALGSKSYEKVKPLSLSASATISNGRVAGFSAFADGGIVDRPTIGMVGEGRKPEAIIPFNKSKGLRQSLLDYGILGNQRGMGSGNPIVHLQFAPNLTVGDIATGNEVTQALQAFATDLETQIQRGLSSARNYSA